MSLHFLGATENVTGSRFLLKANGRRILVDCGMHQERELRSRDWDAFPIPPSSIDTLLITHAHLDHCGYIPKLVREGFSGPIYSTPATAEIMKISLLDSAHLQESDAEHKRRRHERQGRKGPHPEVPLYNVEDAEASFKQFKTVKCKEVLDLGDGISASYYDAGHILGSAMIAVDIKAGTENRRIIFSGDIGRWDRVILRDPSTFESADYIVMESTYGNRTHGAVADIENELQEVIDHAVKAKGNIIVPSFAIERAQEVLYHMNDLLAANKIPHIMVFLDSPMALKVTEVFRHHPELFDEETRELLANHSSPFNFPSLVPVESTDHSKALNYLGGTGMIIAGSGMCTGGRVKHHLVNNISRPESTILFVGYQANGTLGRQIVEGAEEVRILGDKYPVRAQIKQIHGFSAHADQNELLKWLSSIKNTPRKVIVVHGEKESTHDFAELVQKEHGWNVEIPEYREELSLD
ncbi:MAG: MBL fold metallo-hydrolase [Dehalococcoidia bacterium]|nr:MBL fold metallo-hydrolase [Dehalococcoidia bacterium]